MLSTALLGLALPSVLGADPESTRQFASLRAAENSNGASVATIRRRDTSNPKARELVCSASIISSRWLLTAAHCVGEADDIRLGFSSSANDNGVERVVSRAELSLIQLRHALSDTYRPVRMSFLDTSASAFTWHTSGGEKSTILHTSPVALASYDRCSHLFPGTDFASRLCLEPTESQWLCAADGGSPLLQGDQESGWHLTAVASDRLSCGDLSIPNIYVPLTPTALSWIDATAGTQSQMRSLGNHFSTFFEEIKNTTAPTPTPKTKAATGLNLSTAAIIGIVVGAVVALAACCTVLCCVGFAFVKDNVNRDLTSGSAEEHTGLANGAAMAARTPENGAGDAQVNVHLPTGNSTNPPEQFYAEALFDRASNAESGQSEYKDLDFKEGDIVKILSFEDPVGPGWWRGELGGKQGLLPSNYFNEPFSSKSSTRGT